MRIVTAIEKYAEGLERFVNILFQSPRTQHLYNLAAHTWVQMRAVRNAAEGFLPGKVAKLPDKDRQVAAIFSKLWFEMDLAVRQHDDSILKPFPGMMASLMLQVGTFAYVKFKTLLRVKKCCVTYKLIASIHAYLIYSFAV